MKSSSANDSAGNVHVPYRQCAGCRGRFPQHELQRFVRMTHSPDRSQAQRWVADHEGPRSPGRGAYLCRRTECAKRAEKNKKVPGLAAAAAEAGLY